MQAAGELVGSLSALWNHSPERPPHSIVGRCHPMATLAIGGTAGQPSTCDHVPAHPQAGHVQRPVTLTMGQAFSRTHFQDHTSTQAMVHRMAWSTELDFLRAMSKTLRLLTPWTTGLLCGRRRGGDPGSKSEGIHTSEGEMLCLQCVNGQPEWTPP